MRQAEPDACLTMRRLAVDVAVGEPAGDAQRDAVEPRQIVARTEIELAADMIGQQRYRRARDRAVEEARHPRRGADRLDNIEEFEDDRVRLEAWFELGPHLHEGIDGRRPAPRPAFAPDHTGSASWGERGGQY